MVSILWSSKKFGRILYFLCFYHSVHVVVFDRTVFWHFAVWCYYWSIYIFLVWADWCVNVCHLLHWCDYTCINVWYQLHFCIVPFFIHLIDGRVDSHIIYMPHIINQFILMNSVELESFCVSVEDAVVQTFNMINSNLYIVCSEEALHEVNHGTYPEKHSHCTRRSLSLEILIDRCVHNVDVTLDSTE